jgi:hypothetical protein
MSDVVKALLKLLEGYKTNGWAALVLACGIAVCVWHGFVEQNPTWMKPPLSLDTAVIMISAALGWLGLASKGNRIEKKVDTNTAITAEASPEAAAKVMAQPVPRTVEPLSLAEVATLRELLSRVDRQSTSGA